MVDIFKKQEHQMRLDQEALTETIAEEARDKQEEEERLTKEREEAWELGLSSYVSDSYSLKMQTYCLCIQYSLSLAIKSM